MISDADIIAMARSLWPALTISAASDAFLTAWIGVARAFVGTNYGVDQLTGLALFIAHMAYSLDPAGLITGGGSTSGATGAITSITSGRLSVSYGNSASTAASGSISDSQLATTKPGQMLLALRATKAAINAPSMYFGWHGRCGR